MTNIQNYLNNGAFAGDINAIPPEIRASIRHQLFYEAQKAGVYCSAENRKTISELRQIADKEMIVQEDDITSPSETHIKDLQPLTQKILKAVSTWILGKTDWILTRERTHNRNLSQGYKVEFPYIQPHITGLLKDYSPSDK